MTFSSTGDDTLIVPVRLFAPFAPTIPATDGEVTLTQLKSGAVESRRGVDSAGCVADQDVLARRVLLDGNGRRRREPERARHQRDHTCLHGDHQQEGDDDGGREPRPLDDFGRRWRGCWLALDPWRRQPIRIARDLWSRCCLSGLRERWLSRSPSCNRFTRPDGDRGLLRRCRYDGWRRIRVRGAWCLKPEKTARLCRLRSDQRRRHLRRGQRLRHRSRKPLLRHRSRKPLLRHRSLKLLLRHRSDEWIRFCGKLGSEVGQRLRIHRHLYDRWICEPCGRGRCGLAVSLDPPRLAMPFAVEELVHRLAGVGARLDSRARDLQRAIEPLPDPRRQNGAVAASRLAHAVEQALELRQVTRGHRPSEQG